MTCGRPDGLLRYRADTFYGGGAWVLLTAGLAWFLDFWTRRWGPAASPLLWSHAMVLLARLEVEAA